MSRSDTEQEIRDTLGLVPDFFKTMPDDALENEWALFKQFQLTDTELTAREKQLIGYGVAAATYCEYCTYFHKLAATLLGATDGQLEEAARFAAETRKYSTYIHGLQIDMGEFRRQVDEIGEHLQKQGQKQAA